MMATLINRSKYFEYTYNTNWSFKRKFMKCMPKSNARAKARYLPMLTTSHFIPSCKQFSLFAIKISFLKTLTFDLVLLTVQSTCLATRHTILSCIWRPTNFFYRVNSQQKRRGLKNVCEDASLLCFSKCTAMRTLVQCSHYIITCKNKKPPPKPPSL